MFMQGCFQNPMNNIFVKVNLDKKTLWIDSQNERLYCTITVIIIKPNDFAIVTESTQE